MTRRHILASGLAVAIAAVALVATQEWHAVGRAVADRGRHAKDHQLIGALTPEGFALVASLPKRTFRDEPIPLTCEFQNQTRSPATIYACGFWPNHRVIVTDRQGVEPPMTKKGELCLARYKSDARDKNSKMIVKGGGSSKETIDVAGLHHYRPGTYRLKVIFNERDAEPVPLKIESELVEFEIE